MSRLSESSHKNLHDYHEKHMTDGQGCYFKLQDGRLQPQPEQRHWLNAHRQKTKRLLTIRPSDSFVDIGCGEGYLTVPLAVEARYSFGFDFVASALSVFRTQPAYDPRRLSLAIAVGDHIPLPNAHVDKLLCNHVLEHVLDDDAVVREFHRIVRPGGLVLLGVPLELSPQVRFLIKIRRWLWPKARQLQLERAKPGQLVPELIGVQSHIRFYSLTAVRDLLERNGFDMIRAEGIGFSMSGEWRKIIRRNRLLFSVVTAVGYIFPSIGDGVLILARRKS